MHASNLGPGESDWCESVGKGGGCSVLTEVAHEHLDGPCGHITEHTDHFALNLFPAGRG